MPAHEHHHHHHELSADAVKGRAFLFGIVLNTLFVIGEFTAGFLFNSMGLLADAGHNLGDVSGLLISLAAFLLGLIIMKRGMPSGGHHSPTAFIFLVNSHSKKSLFLLTMGLAGRMQISFTVPFTFSRRSLCPCTSQSAQTLLPSGVFQDAR